MLDAWKVGDVGCNMQAGAYGDAIEYKLFFRGIRLTRSTGLNGNDMFAILLLADTPNSLGQANVWPKVELRTVAFEVRDVIVNGHEIWVLFGVAFMVAEVREGGQILR